MLGIRVRTWIFVDQRRHLPSKKEEAMSVWSPARFNTSLPWSYRNRKSHGEHRLGLSFANFLNVNCIQHTAGSVPELIVKLRFQVR